jgi:hypothetical protein
LGEPPPVAQLHRDAAWTCRPGPQLRTQAARLFNHLSCVLQNQGVSSHRSQTHPPLWIRRSTGRDVPAALSYTQGTKRSDASTGLAHNTQVQSGRHWVFTNQNTCIAHHTRQHPTWTGTCGNGIGNRPLRAIPQMANVDLRRGLWGLHQHTQAQSGRPWVLPSGTRTLHTPNHWHTTRRGTWKCHLPLCRCCFGL